MSTRNSALFVSAILLGCLGNASLQAQGLGDLINKAKARANTPTATNPTSGATGGVGVDSTGHPRHISPPDMSTPARERALANAILADPKPGTNEDHDGAEYKRLKETYHFAPVYTADDLFFAQPKWKGLANYYIDWIDHVSDEFLNGATVNYGDAVKESMTKIKAIHFTGRPLGEHVNPDDALDGWKFAYDKGTGTLTIYFGDVTNAFTNRSTLAKWIVKNVS